MELARLRESVGDSMHPVVRAILQSGDSRTYLYKDGDECNVLTGGWVDGHSQGTFLRSKESDHLKITISAASSSAAYVTNNAINLTDVNTLNIEWLCDQAGVGNRGLIFGAGAVKTDNAAEIASAIETTLPFAKKVSQIDVSALSGSYYIKFRVYQSSGVTGSTIGNDFKVWLE
jgi:hypothetical protein